MSTIDREQLATLGRATLNTAEDAAVKVLTEHVVRGATTFAMQHMGIPAAIADMLGRRLETLVAEGIAKARLVKVSAESFVLIDDTEAK